MQDNGTKNLLSESGFSDRFAADFLQGFISANKVSRTLVITDRGPATSKLISGYGVPAVTVLPVSTESGAACRAETTGMTVLAFNDGRPGMSLSQFKTGKDKFDLILFEAAAPDYPGYLDLTRDLLERKGHFLFTDILSSAADSARPVVIRELEAFVAGLHHDKRYEAKMLNLGNGLLLVRKK